MNDHLLDRIDPSSPASLSDLQESEVIEVPLLLPGWQMSALERVAHKHGLTAGEMVRHLLRDFFAGTQAAKVKVG